MLKITVKVDGMACSMCEAHVNEAVRKVCPVKKVHSSHRKGETEILTETDIADEVLQNAIAGCGYTVQEIERTAYEKKGLFRR